MTLIDPFTVWLVFGWAFLQLSPFSGFDSSPKHLEGEKQVGISTPEEDDPTVDCELHLGGRPRRQGDSSASSGTTLYGTFWRMCALYYHTVFTKHIHRYFDGTKQQGGNEIYGMAWAEEREGLLAGHRISASLLPKFEARGSTAGVHNGSIHTTQTGKVSAMFRCHRSEPHDNSRLLVKASIRLAMEVPRPSEAQPTTHDQRCER